MIKVVVLVLTVWNTSNGSKLYEIERDFDRFSVTGDRIEECRVYGVDMAHRLTERAKLGVSPFSEKYPFASTNVDCHWESRPGQKA